MACGKATGEPPGEMLGTTRTGRPASRCQPASSLKPAESGQCTHQQCHPLGRNEALHGPGLAAVTAERWPCPPQRLKQRLTQCHPAMWQVDCVRPSWQGPLAGLTQIPGATYIPPQPAPLSEASQSTLIHHHRFSITEPQTCDLLYGKGGTLWALNHGTHPSRHPSHLPEAASLTEPWGSGATSEVRGMG